MAGDAGLVMAFGPATSAVATRAASAALIVVTVMVALDRARARRRRLIGCGGEDEG